MIEIDVVSTGNINNKNGVNIFMLNLVKNKKIFENQGIFLNKLLVGGNFIDVKNDLAINKIIITSKVSDKFIKKLKNIKNTTFLGNLISFLKNGPLQAIKNVYKLKKLKNKKTIFIQDISTCYFFKKKNDKIIMTIHSSDNPLIQTYYNYPKFKNSFMEKIIQHILHKAIIKADATIVLSEHFKQQLIDKGYKNIYSVYNGVPHANLIKKLDIKIQDKPIKIITVSSITYRKGIDLLIKAFNKLTDNEKNKLRITIVGIGNDMIEFEELIKTYKLEKFIKFLGLRNDIEQLLYDHDIFLMTSRDEGLPIAMLEAMSVGLPLALTNVGSIPEVLDSNCYFPLEPNIDEIYQFYLKLSHNEIDLISLVNNSNELFNNRFSINTMINNYASIIKKINK